MTQEEIEQFEHETQSILLLITATITKAEYAAGGPSLAAEFLKNILEVATDTLAKKIKEKGWIVHTTT